MKCVTPTGPPCDSWCFAKDYYAVPFFFFFFVVSVSRQQICEYSIRFSLFLLFWFFFQFYLGFFFLNEIRLFLDVWFSEQDIILILYCTRIWWALIIFDIWWTSNNKQWNTFMEYLGLFIQRIWVYFNYSWVRLPLAYDLFNIFIFFLKKLLNITKCCTNITKSYYHTIFDHHHKWKP